ncbi:hypothetical protein V8Z80_14375 [Orrella sp. JC864]|uniref:hypothetical protein n=1 Tax=Orrella sp. JC864 TaxID=3120298 RepID=UPI0012BB9E13
MNDPQNVNFKRFRRGFVRGLAGALTLYSPATIPAPARIDVQPLREPAKSASEALRNDWVQTGKDIDAAVAKYGKTRSKAS